MPDSINYIDWLKRGEHDLIVAESAFQDSDFTDTICHLAHQATEKYLKSAWLFYNKVPPRTHDLMKLLSFLIQYEKNFEDFKEKCRFINLFFIETKYPSNQPWLPSREDAKKILTSTREIFDFVQKKLNG